MRFLKREDSLGCPPRIVLPEAGNGLRFRQARKGELGKLKALYEAAWGSGIKISEEQIKAKITNFPQGQIVGCEGDEPVSMVNIMLSGIGPEGFEGGYEKVTGGRTFSTHTAPETIGDRLPVALCVSIAVPPEHAGKGYAISTLRHAIRFSADMGFIAVPYSAPRGFARARQLNPKLDIITYLHMTRPARMTYGQFLRRNDELNSNSYVMEAYRLHRLRAHRLFSPTRERFEEYQAMPKDSLMADVSDTAFARFMMVDGQKMSEAYERQMTIEDFCLLTGRELADPVMRLHVGNGARFIRDAEGGITAVFSGSRPEDISSLGYNVVLTYGYHPALVSLYPG